MNLILARAMHAIGRFDPRPAYRYEAFLIDALMRSGRRVR